MRPVAWSVVAATLPHLAPQVAAMVQLQYWAGMRPGEVCAMRRADLDLRGPVWFYRPPRHKNSWRGRGLVKAIPGGLQAVLEPWLGCSLVAPIFAPPRAIRWSVARYRLAVLEGQQAAGVAAWSPLQLRHGIATELARQVGIESARRWLGHSSLASTEIYAERDAAELVAIAAAVERLRNAQ